MQHVLQVSLFRPIPWTPCSLSDSDDCDTTTVIHSLASKTSELSSPLSQMQKYEHVPSFINPEKTDDAPSYKSLSCASTPSEKPSAFSSNKLTSKSEPSTPGSPDCDRTSRPNFLRLRPEFSAFKQAGLPNPQALNSDLSQEKRMTVKELASNIERKNTKWSTSKHSPGSAVSKKAVLSAQADSQRKSLPPKPPTMAKPEALLQKPILLQTRLDTQSLGRSVARKGTMERYRERKMLESNLSSKKLTSIGEFENDKKPQLTPYNPSTDNDSANQSVPKRGILKHHDIKPSANASNSLVAPQKEKENEIDPEEYLPVFIHENSPKNQPISIASSESDSELELNNRFETAKDSITNLYQKKEANANHKQPTRPKLLRRQSPNRDRHAVRHVNTGNESLFYVRSLSKSTSG